MLSLYSLSKESNVIVHRYTIVLLLSRPSTFFTAIDHPRSHFKFRKLDWKATPQVQARMFDKQRHAKDLDGSSGGIINKQNRGARDQRLYRLKFFFPVVMVVCLLGEYTNLHKTPGQYSKSFFSPAKIFSIFFFEERSKSGLQCSKSSRERLLCSHFFLQEKISLSASFHWKKKGSIPFGR